MSLILQNLLIRYMYFVFITNQNITGLNMDSIFTINNVVKYDYVHGHDYGY